MPTPASRSVASLAQNGTHGLPLKPFAHTRPPSLAERRVCLKFAVLATIARSVGIRSIAEAPKKPSTSGQRFLDIAIVFRSRDRAAMTERDDIAILAFSGLADIADRRNRLVKARRCLCSPTMPELVVPTWATIMSAPIRTMPSASLTLNTYGAVTRSSLLARPIISTSRSNPRSDFLERAADDALMQADGREVLDAARNRAP